MDEAGFRLARGRLFDDLIPAADWAERYMTAWKLKFNDRKELVELLEKAKQAGEIDEIPVEWEGQQIAIHPAENYLNQFIGLVVEFEEPVR